ncbi:MAG TPA: flagellar hook protein FlgE [Symbiobacteriaceae bacterium]
MRALNSAVTGIRAHQTRMDVIGNNIANVNTVGFKSSRVTFQDVFSQTLAAGSATTNPKQVGLGVGVASIDLDMSAGSPNLTGRALDLAIEGEGMFIMRQGDGSVVYTRVGNFDWSADGVLVNPGTGARVQGWAVDENGEVVTGVLTDIVLPKGSTAPPQVTTRASLSGYLDPTAAAGSEVSTTLIIYDSLGRPHSVTLTFVRDANDPTEWDVTAFDGQGNELDTTGLSFDATGAVDPDTWEITFTTSDTDEEITVTIDLSGIRLGYSGTGVSNVMVQSADGAPMGTLESVTISPDGQVIGIYSNGARIVHAYIALANFTNPAGLSKVGDTSFAETAASGPVMIGLPNTGGRGRLVPGNLEASNVDLSVEFTNMILTQRGFQANARVVSTADEMLQDLVNLRR